MKKKVIFVTQALWIGGIESALVNLLNHLDYEKYDISCLITEDYQQMADLITPKCKLYIFDRNHISSFGSTYHFSKLYGWMEESPNGSLLGKHLKKFLRLCFKRFEVKQYASYIKKQMSSHHFDTAVIYSDRVAELTVRAIDANKYIMFYHNADIGRNYHDIYGYRASDFIVCVSQSQCEKLKKALPIYSDKMIYIHNYIDVGSILNKAALFEDVLFPVDGFYIVSCGRLAYQKGFDFAVEACALLIQSGYTNVQWYVLGEGPLRRELELLIKEKKVDKNFHLVGIKKNPFPYMKAADLYVQSSRSEGYSLSILEARVLGCPIVATFESANEQIENGVTGSLCDCNPSSMAENIIQMIENPELSEIYKNNLKEYSFEKENASIIQQVEEIL